jgi:tetratricopeptide (TPR) repeat protein
MKIDALASSHYKAGRWVDAEEMLRQAVSMRAKVLGNTHPDTITTLSNHASALGRLERFEEAEELFRRCLAWREVHIGPSNIDTLQTMNHIAVLLKQRGNFVESNSYFERALEGFSEELGPEQTIFSAETAYNFAILCVQTGRRRSAGMMFGRAHKGLASCLGKDHLHALDALAWEMKCTKDLTNIPEDKRDVFISRNLWQDVDSCELCKATFTFFRRQHHCRVCSRACCSDCSKFGAIVIEFDSQNKVRICRTCKQQGF